MINLPILPVEFEKVSMGVFMDGLNMTENGRRYAQIILVTLAVYLGMKYLSPVLSPFVFAFLLAAVIHPLAARLHRIFKVRESILAALILFLLAGLFLFLLWCLFSLLWTEGQNLAVQLPDFQEEFGVLLQNCCCGLENRFGIDGVVIENFVLEQVDILIENLEVKVLPAMMGKSFDCIKGIAGGISFFVVMAIAVLLIMKDYGRLVEMVQEREEWKGVVLVCKKVLLYIKTFVKAQLTLLLIISTICAVTLALIGTKGGIIYGLITGFMDMLPFIGTGIMLTPLALFLLFEGKVWQALICFLLYAVCALTREFLEPRLIGNKIGVWPVGILFAVFAGIRLFGIPGIVKGPLSLVIISEVCRYLWEKKETAE